MERCDQRKLNAYSPGIEDKIFIKLGNIDEELFSISCKEFYNEFVVCKYERPTAMYTWEEFYYYANFDWKILFKIPYIVARETNLQSLQYQIINRYIPCYANLKLWGKESSNKCPLCNEVDTIEHFFFQCLSVDCIWTFLKKLFQITYDF